MIRVENLHKHFGNLKVLTGIEEHIEEGEVVVVIGPSGSGKSTFLRCLNLLETPTEGKIFVDAGVIYKKLFVSQRKLNNHKNWYHSNHSS